MKRLLLYPIILSTFLVSLVSLLTYRLIAIAKTEAIASETNPSYTLIFPDQEYVITKRDLDTTYANLIIPTQDDATPKIAYNSTDGLLESISSPKDYIVDITLLKNSISSVPGDLATLVPDYVIQDRLTESLTQYNFRLNRIHRSPLKISLKDGSEMAEFALDSTLLRTLLKPLSIELNVPPQLDKDLLLVYISQRLTPKQRKYFSADAAYQNTQKAINLRFMGEATPVVLGVDDGPSSYGELADKYLEVDLSQQKMYFFINHSLYKEYKVSTGAEYPTPVGEFHILNKAPLAFSDIYQVWMPYWMGFKYANDVGAYLGLHEIAYVKGPNGKPVYRYGYYIGDMMTGGCVAMEPKDSREIYNLSEVGMLVRVVK